MVGRWLLAASFFITLASCKDAKTNDSAPPPPPPSAVTAPGACGSGGGQIADPVSVSLFPRVLAGYCLDPSNDTKTYGDKAKLSMDDVCTTALDGECEVYKSFGLARYVAVHYVDGSGGGGTVQVNLSTYKTPAGAYAMFTKRVIADGDPAGPAAPRPLDAGGAAAMGTGSAYVWRDASLAELQYSNEEESPEQLAKSSERILATLGKEIGARLPGPTSKPDAAARLPTDSLIPNGIAYVVKDALGIPGAGAGAEGFYAASGAAHGRYRLFVSAATDVVGAKSAMKALESRPGTLPIASLGEEAAEVVVQTTKESPKAAWVFARKGATLVGAGDEELAPGAGRLSKDAAIAKVRALLEAPPFADAGKR